MDWPAAEARLLSLFPDDEELREAIAGRLAQQDHTARFFTTSNRATKIRLRQLLPQSGMQSCFPACRKGMLLRALLASLRKCDARNRALLIDVLLRTLQSAALQPGM